MPQFLKMLLATILGIFICQILSILCLVVLTSVFSLRISETLQNTQPIDFRDFRMN